MRIQDVCTFRNCASYFCGRFLRRCECPVFFLYSVVRFFVFYIRNKNITYSENDFGSHGVLSKISIRNWLFLLIFLNSGCSWRFVCSQKWRQSVWNKKQAFLSYWTGTKNKLLIIIKSWDNLHMFIWSRSKQTLYYGTQTTDIHIYISF